MKSTQKIVITDCEGPVSKNDNAFEMTSHFVPNGETLFNQVSRYDDVLADVVKRKSYKAGDTLRLILPFLKAYKVTDRMMTDFSTHNILLMPGAKGMLQHAKNVMPTFIVSTSYEHYMKALCNTLDFPYKNTFCTQLTIDHFRISREEEETLRRFSQEICTLPPIEIPEMATSLHEFSDDSQLTIRRLDEVFWEEILQMDSGQMLREVNPVGGVEKAKAVAKITSQTRSSLGDIIYVGDSITDVECFRLIKEKGGLAVSFNGNAYAVREAEFAILSSDAFIIAVLADVFNTHGKQAVHSLLKEWSHEGLRKIGLDMKLQKRLQELFPQSLPKLDKITPANVDELTTESSAFRKLVRGEKVGRLG